jgi:hypothetical protein
MTFFVSDECSLSGLPSESEPTLKCLFVGDVGDC